MSQDTTPERDPVEEYWASHGNRQIRWVTPGFTDGTGQTAFEWFYEDQRREDPWCNGRYAFASIVWGLIFMLLVSIPAGASGTSKKHPGTKVKAIEQRETKQSCLSPVRVVGSQWATADGAEESAQKAWAETVRFNHGEAFMQLDQAVGYQKRCSRSSVGEMVGQTLIRCEVDAAPCRPPFTAGAQ
jgi:hypothetical protein